MVISVLPSADATASESAILNVTLVRATPSSEAVSTAVSSVPDKSPLMLTTGSSDTAANETVKFCVEEAVLVPSRVVAVTPTAISPK